jgi:hypothetical protein
VTSMGLTEFLLGPFLPWILRVFMGAAFLFGGFLYFKELNSAKVYGREPCHLLKWLAGSIAVFRVVYAIILTAGQYYIWSASMFSKVLLTLPLDQQVPIPSFFMDFLSRNKLGYFVLYSFGRFWLDVIITLAVAFGFYFILKLLHKYKDRFFVAGETELGLAAALIVGWPNFVIFLPLTFLFVVLLSTWNIFFSETKYTTLGTPLLLASLVAFVCGNYLVDILGLHVLYTSNQIVGSLL